MYVLIHRKELGASQQNVNGMRDQLTAAERTSEKLKRDNQQAFNNLQVRTKINKVCDLLFTYCP